MGIDARKRRILGTIEWSRISHSTSLVTLATLAGGRWSGNSICSALSLRSIFMSGFSRCIGPSTAYRHCQCFSATHAMTTCHKKFGLLLGFLGMCLFAGTLPATRLAVSGFAPLFLAAARAALVGSAGLLVLVALRRRVPPRSLWLEIFGAALGTVVGFPLFAALAMMTMPVAVRFTLIGGKRSAMRRSEIVLHVINHTSYHHGFVADMFYQIPARPPLTDLPVFLTTR